MLENCLLAFFGGICGGVLSDWIASRRVREEQRADERAAKLLNEIADEAEPGETIIVRVGDVVVQTTIPVADDEELPF